MEHTRIVVRVEAETLEDARHGQSKNFEQGICFLIDDGYEVQIELRTGEAPLAFTSSTEFRAWFSRPAYLRASQKYPSGQ